MGGSCEDKYRSSISTVEEIMTTSEPEENAIPVSDTSLLAAGQPNSLETEGGILSDVHPREEVNDVETPSLLPGQVTLVATVELSAIDDELEAQVKLPTPSFPSLGPLGGYTFRGLSPIPVGGSVQKRPLPSKSDQARQQQKKQQQQQQQQQQPQQQQQQQPEQQQGEGEGQ